MSRTDTGFDPAVSARRYFSAAKVLISYRQDLPSVIRTDAQIRPQLVQKDIQIPIARDECINALKHRRLSRGSRRCRHLPGARRALLPILTRNTTWHDNRRSTALMIAYGENA